LPPVHLPQLRLQGLLVVQQAGLLAQGELLAWLIPLAILLVAVFLGGAVVVFTARWEWQS
jgi:hypothetical protein